MIKRILLFLITAIVAVSFSAFTSNPDTKVSIKKAKTDSIETNVNINNHAGRLSISPQVDAMLMKFLTSSTEINDMKKTILDDMVNKDFENPNDKYSRIDNIVNDTGYSKENLIKGVQNETKISFWSNFMITLFYILVIWVYAKRRSEGIDWKAILAESILVFIFITILSTYLVSMLSYLFNSNYINIVKLINL